MGLVVDPHHPPVLGDPAALHHVGLAGPVGALVLGEHPVPVVGVDGPGEEVGIRQVLPGAVAEHALELRAGVGEGVAADVPNVGYRR